MPIHLTPEGKEELISRIAHIAEDDVEIQIELENLGVEYAATEVGDAVRSCIVAENGNHISLIVPHDSRNIMVAIATRIGEIISTELGMNYDFSGEARVW